MKSALNLDLTRSNARSRQGDAASIFFMVVGAFCVELWSFYYSKRISVPMSYISFWDQCYNDVIDDDVSDNDVIEDNVNEADVIEDKKFTW